MSFPMFEVEYRIGKTKVRGTFVLSLEEIERHVGPFEVLNYTELHYVPPPVDQTFYKDWLALWGSASLETNMKKCQRCGGFHEKTYQYTEKFPR